MKQYYIPYTPGEKKFNYLPILYLYKIAEYNKETKTYNKIAMRTLGELAEKINNAFGTSVISKSTLSRVLNDERYKNFLSYDRERKEIILQNDFRSKPGEKKKQSFIVLSEMEFDFLAKSQDSLLIQYFFYLRYFCGISKSKKTDSTAKQFLAACGYSATSGNYISRISEYNSLLSSSGFLTIQKIREQGKERNLYSL